MTSRKKSRRRTRKLVLGASCSMPSIILMSMRCVA